MFPLPQQASDIAGTVDTIFAMLIGLGCFFSGIVAMLIVFFAIYYRHGSRANRKNPPTNNVRVEVAWSLALFVLALGVFLWAASVFMRDTRAPDDSLQIYVVGKQWMWKIQHPDGQREINELHIPVNTDINLNMISEDVIHSFWVPDFRLKQDLLPGRYTQMWFKAVKTGVYAINCAEYCGTSHSEMVGVVYVLSQTEYQEWLSGNTVSQPLSTQGEQLFTKMGCASCHLENNSGRGPSLVGLQGKAVHLASGQVVIADDQYIRKSIVNSDAQIVQGYPNIMPAFQDQLSEEEIIALMEYISSLQTQTNQEDMQN